MNMLGYALHAEEKITWQQTVASRDHMSIAINVDVMDMLPKHVGNITSPVNYAAKRTRRAIVITLNSPYQNKLYPVAFLRNSVEQTLIRRTHHAHTKHMIQKTASSWSTKIFGQRE